MSIPRFDSTGAGLAGKPTPYCLYFLVSKATSGPLASLVKVGIAECFAARHEQHRKVWGDFDLRRSALLRGVSLREARHLEMALRYAFGNADAEHTARQAGKKLSSADYVALNSWRRHPGRYDEGHTEFFAAECLPDMLGLVEFWLRCRGKRVGETRLQRGLTPADGALRLNADGSVPPALSKEERRERRAQEEAESQQKQAEVDAVITGKVRRLLDLALAYEEHLVWVDLTRWRRERSWIDMAGGIVDGLADLYFSGFGPAPFALDPAQRPAAMLRLEEQFLQIEVPVTWPDNYRERTAMERWVRVRRAWYWEEPPLRCSWHADPPPFCRQALRLRLDPVENKPALPFFDEFEALARRVEGRHRWEQPEL